MTEDRPSRSRPAILLRRALFFRWFVYIQRYSFRDVMRKERSVIGRSERGDFPALGLKRVGLKIDTGAYSSAIHCTKIEISDEGLLSVIFLADNEAGFTGKELNFRRFERRRIKSSSGHSELRYAIETELSLAGKVYEVRLTLTDRSAMRVPVLLGRRFLKRNKFVVDPSRRYQLTGKSGKTNKL